MSSLLPVRTVLARNIVLLRRARNWSQTALALEAGLHRTFIAHVECQARNVSIDNVEKIAHALGVPVHELLLADRRPALYQAALPAGDADPTLPLAAAGLVN